MSGATSYTVGVDIGGTKIAFVLVDSGGAVVAQARIATQADAGADAMCQRIARQIDTWAAQYRLAGVGVGCPGFIDSAGGIVQQAVHLHWQDVPLRDGIRQYLHHDIPVIIENDVRALLAGETRFGVAQSARDVVYLALGTGLGAAAMIDGHLLRGAYFTAMEIGHLALIPEGRLCVCGKRGCLDMVIAGTGVQAGIHEYAAQHPHSPLAAADATPQDFVAHLSTDDPIAQRIREDIITHLTATVAWCSGILNPALIVIGGGLGHAIAPYILDDVRVRLNQHTLLSPEQQPGIQQAAVLDTARGAASLIDRP